MENEESKMMKGNLLTCFLMPLVKRSLDLYFQGGRILSPIFLCHLVENLHRMNLIGSNSLAVCQSQRGPFLSSGEYPADSAVHGKK